MHTLAKANGLASSQNRRTSAWVASGLSRVWSSQPANAAPFGTATDSWAFGSSCSYVSASDKILSSARFIAHLNQIRMLNQLELVKRPVDHHSLTHHIIILHKA